jgi:hypothetical protein
LWKSVQWKPHFIYRHKWIPICTFHFFNPLWLKFDVGNVNIILLIICEFNYYWHREGEGDTLLMGKHQIASTCISMSFLLSPLHTPLLHLHPLLDQGVEMSYKCRYSCNDGYPYGQTTITVHFETSHHCHNFVFRNYHSRNTAGQGQELWMIYTVKQPFKEHCIWYNYTLLIWVIFQDQKKWMITAEKWHT